MNNLLSIYTLYNYDNTLFDNLQIPSALSIDTLRDNLIIELAELELIYNDPDFLKSAIGFWSAKHIDKWDKLYETTQFDYNAIENYNRVDDITDAETRNLTGTKIETRNLTGSDNETRNLTDTNNATLTNSGSDTTTKKVTGYNDNALVDNESDTVELGSVNSNVASGTNSGTVNKSMTDAGTVTDAITDSGTVTNVKSGTSKGNIGVTTTQQMIEQERGVLEFEMYDYIIQEFKSRFCLLRY